MATPLLFWFSGSYGSIPLPVTFAATELALEIERNPDKFMRLTMKPMLDKARYVVRDIGVRRRSLTPVSHSREAVAGLIGAGADEVVLVPNATHALNTVLRNFEWREGDLLIGGD